MSRRIKKNKIEGRFVPIQHSLLTSEAYKSLGTSAKIAYIYFLKDIKSSHQTDVILTFEQAKKFLVCTSPSTFQRVKKELVSHGFLDSVDGGGLNAPSKFKISYRWKKYDTDLFENSRYKSGFGSKYFRAAWKDENRKNRLIEARLKKKKI